jgi:two-component system cell cycle sensor histidine kinase/response regulator CckA
MSPAPFLASDQRHRKRIIALLAAGVLAVVGLLAYQLWSSYREAIREAEIETRNYAAIFDARLDATLRRTDTDLQALARTVPVAALSRQAVPRYASELDAELDSRLNNFQELVGLRVFDANGELLYTSDRASSLTVNIADRSYFRALRDKPQAGLVFSEVVISRITGRQSVIAARALRDRQGNFRGIVFAGIDVAHFQKLFQTLNLGARGVIAIHRSDDFTPVVRWPLVEGKTDTPLPPGTPIRAAVTAGRKTGTVEFSASSDGVARIYSFHLLDRYPFFVSAGLARDEVLAGWRAHAFQIGVSGFLLLGLLALLLLRLWRAQDQQMQVMNGLVESEKRFRTLFEQAAVGVALTESATGRYVRVNKKFADVLGYSPVEILQHTFRDLTHPDDLPGDLARTARLTAREISDFSMEKRYIRKDGSVVWGYLTVSPIWKADGTYDYHVAIVQDITERKQAEAAQARLAAIVNSSNDAIFSRSLDRKIVSWNPAAERLFGWTAAEAIGQSTEILVPPDLEEGAARIRALLAQGVAVVDFETERLTKDGRRIPVSLTYSPIKDASGTTIGVSNLCRDIRARVRAEEERRMLEAQLRQAQKMDAVGTLAGGIAHDFNNILGAIIGNAELVRQDLGAQHPALESLEEIRKASQRAKTLVNQILAFSRQQPLPRHALSLAPVIEEAVKLLRATLPAGIELATNLAEDAPQVLAAATQLHQVIVNLCANAWQAMDGKPGRIDIVLEGMNLDAATEGLQPGRYAYLSVRDTGSGMDAATQARIFEPFFTTRAAGQGTGLGLSVVHGIVEGHQGAILVQSAPEGGTTFHLYFPAADPAAETVPPKPESTAPQRGNGQHVLYLDDEEALVMMVPRLLERLGYRVSGYTSAKEALAAVRADPGQFDLVVTDYNMPGMSGLDVADELARIRPDLQVAVTSGYISDELRQKAPASGVQHLIYKPNTVEELCDAVHRLTREIRR